MYAPGNSALVRFFEPLRLWKGSPERNIEPAAGSESVGHLDGATGRMAFFVLDVALGAWMFSLVIVSMVVARHLIDHLPIDQPLMSAFHHLVGIILGTDVVLLVWFTLKSVWRVLRWE
jgi:hypothetical protein